MDYYGSKHKCEHEERPYKDCNYHVRSTGKYSHVEPDKIRIWMPKNEEEASWCMSYLEDI